MNNFQIEMSLATKTNKLSQYCSTFWYIDKFIEIFRVDFFFRDGTQATTVISLQSSGHCIVTFFTLALKVECLCDINMSMFTEV